MQKGVDIERHSGGGVVPAGKVATDTKILYLRTRYRYKLSWFFWFWPIQRYDTTKGKWQILYLRTRYRYKLGSIFWIGTIHVTIPRNLASRIKFAFKADFSSLLLATKRTGKARTCKENDGDEKRRNNFSSHLCRSALHSAVASEPIVRGAIQ